MNQENEGSHNFDRVQHHPSSPPTHYGTFQGVPQHHSLPPSPHYYDHNSYQAVPGHVVAEGTPVRHHRRRLPCCGCGVGWVLFGIGFILAAIPWYVGAFIMLCGRIDPREKPGYIACAVAAVLATIAVAIGATKF